MANERVIFSLPTPLRQGEQVALNISFAGSLGTNMRGLYLSTYVDDSGAVVNIVGERGLRD